MAEHVVPLIPEDEISKFAKSLFQHLYYDVGMIHYRPNPSQHDIDAISTAVLAIRNSTRDFNVKILNDCGFGVDKMRLCQEVCNLYPSQMYFKRLYFITGFILDMMYEWYEASDAVDYSQGHRTWKTIFRGNFESEFESQGGWDAFYAAGKEWTLMHLDGILPSEDLLPALVAGIVARVRPFNPVPQRVVPDDVDVDAALERLRVGQMDINEASDESMPSEEEIGENQPEKVALVEGSKEESQPGVMDDSTGHSGIGSNVDQAGHLGESSSGRSGEDTSHSHGDRYSRKRSAPSESDPNKKPDSLSPSKAKMDKRDSRV